jgi:hypothetical protein
LISFPKIGTAQNLLYKISTVSVVGISLLDSHSSWGKREANPVLGTKFNGRSLAIKSGIVGGMLLLQYLHIKKVPAAQKVYTKLNFGFSAVNTGIVIRNYQIKKEN